MNLRTAKRLLFAILMVGVAAYFGMNGTFANFSAETANQNSSIASGTLTMSDQLNSATACFSTDALSGDNTNNGCGAAFTSTGVAPGAIQPSQIAKITVKNTGTIDGANLSMYGSRANGILTGSDIHTGDTVHNIPIGGGVEGIMSVGDLVSLSDGGNTQLFTVSATPTPAANSNGGATTVTVTPVPATADFRAGHATLTDVDGNTTDTDTDCYDSKTSDGQAFGFNSITASTAYQSFNPMCGSVVIWVQESTGGNNYCWMGDGSPHSSASFSEAQYGLCVAPLASTVGGAGLSSTVTTIPVPGGINGNVSSGDFINVTQGSLTQQFQASADATVGANSISVNSLALNAGFTANAVGATITDPTKQGLLDAFYHTDSLTNFDLAPRTELLPIAGIDAVTHVPYLDTSTTHAPDLAANASRTFYIGIYLPKPAGSTQNNLQGLSSTFGITWLLNQ